VICADVPAVGAVLPSRPTRIDHNVRVPRPSRTAVLVATAGLLAEASAWDLTSSPLNLAVALGAVVVLAVTCWRGGPGELARADTRGARVVIAAALLLGAVGAAIRPLVKDVTVTWLFWVGLAVLAVFAHAIFGQKGLALPILVASLLPLAQAPEGVAAAVLVVRRRYDVRAGFLVVSMALRLAALALGAPHGVTAAVTAIVIAQVVATAAIGVAAWVAVRRYPAGAREPLAEDRQPFRSFVVRSSIGSVLSPMRGILGTLLVGIVTGPLQVAYFRVAQAPQNAFAALSSPARLVLLSEQTHQVESGRTDLLYRMLRRYVMGTTAAMVVLVPPLLWLTPWFIRLAYKDKHGVSYLGATDAMRLMLVVGAIQVVWGWTKSYPVSIGRPELRIVAQSLEIAVLIPLLIVLASLYGATGAAAAFLVASVVFAAVWTVIVLRLRKEPGGIVSAAPELVAPDPLLP